jgi:RHS repeat-associated protein
MARTAPAPNIPPIPGMNPCTWLAGGGGAGGGGGSGNGKGGDGKGGADGEKGDGDPDGGGKGSGACGAGANGGCTNCGHSVAKGDPVDVATGKVFTIPKTDLFLPGAFDLDLIRSYSSERNTVDLGIGFGWTHSLAWRLEERRRSLVLYAGDGRRVVWPKLEIGEEARQGAWGVLRGKQFYAVRPGNEFVHFFGTGGSEDGIHRLQFVRYRNRGHLSLQYESGRLARVIDSVGRIILFEGSPAGRIESIAVPDARGNRVVYARYAYDSEGNLVAAADAEGHSTLFAYDDHHRLTRMEYPSGIVFHFVYDREGRCTETWGDARDGADPAIAQDVPAVLLDGARAKGIYHCRFTYSGDGYTEVVDSERLQRFETGPGLALAKAVDARGGVTTREFDARERITAVTDPTGATWRYEYDFLDQVVSEIDPEGNQVRVVRDGGARELQIFDAAGGVISIGRDFHGEVEWLQVQNGATQQLVLGQRGNAVQRNDERGGKHHYEYDAHSNLVAYTSPSGARHQYAYDYWGRLRSEIDALGREYRYTYSNGGRLLEAEDPLGRRTNFEYDSMGNLVAHSTPDGATTRWEFGGLNWMHCMRQPDGSEIRLWYNREGWPLRIQNERGERHEFSYGASGLVESERDFHGRTTRYGYDRLGRKLWFDEGLGKHTFTRNAIGQIIAEETPDGSTVRYAFNPRGELVWAESQDVRLEWVRDAIGGIVREDQIIDGVPYSIESERDGGGTRTAVRTSLGHALHFGRDVEGRLNELRTPAGRALTISRDALGAPVRRELSQGAALIDTYDAGMRLRRRRVEPPGVATSEPEWVGSGRPNAIDTLYDYSEADELTHVQRATGETVELEYDVRRHLSRRQRGKNVEGFSADRAGNYQETQPQAPPRRYGTGNQLLLRGEVEYVHDARGFLVEQRRTVPGSAAAERTRYEWNGWGRLAAVELPDETRVEFGYDPFARRVAKRVLKDDQVVSSHHYVWDLLSMVHDVPLDATAKDGSLRTYLYYDNDDELPIAHLEGREPSAWMYYVGALTGAPEQIVDGAGKLLGELDYQAFGRAELKRGSATTPFRFPGQQEDAETGLHYNRYRYYDPDTGRYISPDPVGIAGGLNLYSYGPNPIAWVDPMGWAPKTKATIGGSLPFSSPNNIGSKDNPAMKSGNVNCPVELQSPGGTARELVKSCPEQKAMLEDIKRFGGGKGAGKTRVMTGEYPPCPNCHAAMMRMSKETGADVTYNWTGKDGSSQSVSYKGGTGEPHGHTAGESSKLKDDYSKVKLTDSWSPQIAPDNERVRDKHNPGSETIAPGATVAPGAQASTPQQFWGFDNPNESGGNNQAWDSYNSMLKDR